MISSPYINPKPQTQGFFHTDPHLDPSTDMNHSSSLGLHVPPPSSSSRTSTCKPFSSIARCSPTICALLPTWRSAWCCGQARVVCGSVRQRLDLWNWRPRNGGGFGKSQFQQKSLPNVLVCKNGSVPMVKIRKKITLHKQIQGVCVWGAIFLLFFWWKKSGDKNHLGWC